MAEHLEIGVVVEGIETQAQADHVLRRSPEAPARAGISARHCRWRPSSATTGTSRAARAGLSQASRCASIGRPYGRGLDGRTPDRTDRPETAAITTGRHARIPLHPDNRLAEALPLWRNLARTDRAPRRNIDLADWKADWRELIAALDRFSGATAIASHSPRKGTQP